MGGAPPAVAVPSVRLLAGWRRLVPLSPRLWHRLAKILHSRRAKCDQCRSCGCPVCEERTRLLETYLQIFSGYCLGTLRFMLSKLLI